MNNNMIYMEMFQFLNRILRKEKINIEELNFIIEIFLMFNDYFSFSQEELKNNEKIGDYLVELVEYYNSNKDNYIKTEHGNQLKELFLTYSSELKEKLLIKIVVVIEDFTDKKLIDRISNNVEVVKIVNIKELLAIGEDFQYVLNMCEDIESKEKILEKLKIEKNRVLNLKEEYINYYKELIFLYKANYPYSKLVTALKEAKENKNIDMICTGLSYTMKGYFDKLSKYNCVNLSSSSQDLYYDFLIAKDVIRENRNIKRVLIGMAYYSFNWDLSSTKNESIRIKEVYYPIFKDKHNLKEEILQDNEFDIMKLFSKKDPLKYIFDEYIYEDILREKFGWELNSELINVFWNNSTYLEHGILDNNEEFNVVEGKKRAEVHNKINYLKTREENFNILRDYLEFLKDNEIEPIIVVFPVTKYYRDNFSLRMKEEFYNNINLLREKYDFQIIDLFNEDFPLSYFADYDHLNKQGAIKCTEIINSII